MLILKRNLDKSEYNNCINIFKAFDMGITVLLHEKLWDWSERQKVNVVINGCKREAKIRKWVRQQCPLWPYLFNIFFEEAKIMLKEETKGIYGRKQWNEIQ